MTGILQDSLPSANSSKFTYSGFFRFPSIPMQDSGGSTAGGAGRAGFVDLFAWGDPVAYTWGNLNSCISVGRSNGSWVGATKIDAIMVNLLGLVEGVATNSPPTWLNPKFHASSGTDAADLISATEMGPVFNAWIELDFGGLAPHVMPILPLTWYHLFVSADSGFVDQFQIAPHQQPLTLNKKLHVNLNRVDVLYGAGSTGLENSVGVAILNNDYFPDDIVNPPSFNISIVGRECGLPTISNFSQTSPIFEVANVQVWFGTYVEPTVGNLDKFVLLNGSGNPIPPPDVRAAQDAFGDSDIWFVRDSVSDIKFQENQGVAGPFTLVGTAPVDFNPAPEDV